MHLSAVNLTPHIVRVQYPDGTTQQFSPMDEPHLRVRVSTTEVPVDDCGYFFRHELGEVVIPDDVEWPLGPEGVAVRPRLIVSSMVLDAAERQSHPLLSRLIAPDSGATAIREQGQVVAVCRFIVASCHDSNQQGV